ncbi:MAG: CHAD domain-containing protein, partial [Zwartia sp.]
PPLILDDGQTPTDTENVTLSRPFQSWLLDMLAWTVLPIAPVASLKTSSAIQEPQDPASVALATQVQSAVTQSVGQVAAHAAAQVAPRVALQSAVEVVATANIKVQKPLTLKEALVKKLKKWHRRLLQDGLQFAQLDIEPRHELRKRGKKLRYALQFTESLLPTARLKTYRKQLAAVQDILGEMNDLAVARDRFISLRDTQPSAWFACGWITSRLDALTQDACTAFKQLSRTETFWR